MTQTISEELRKRNEYVPDIDALLLGTECSSEGVWPSYQAVAGLPGITYKVGTTTPNVLKLGLLTGVIVVGSMALVANPPVIYAPTHGGVLSLYADPYSTLGAEQLFLGQRYALEAIVSLKTELARLKRLRKDNWDGEGADAISDETIATAEAVVATLANAVIQHPVEERPSLIPMPDGSVLLKWIVGERELAVTVLDTTIEVQRWNPATAYTSEGLWAIAIDQVPEHFDWLRA